MNKPWLAAIALCQRELVRFVRQPNRVFGALGQPILFWILFSAGFQPSGLNYEFFFPGTLAMILLFTAIFSTVSIIEDRREGFLQSVLVSPAPRWAMTLGKILGGTLLATGQGALFLALGYLTLPLDHSIGAMAGTLALSLVIAFALTSLGFVLAWQMDSTQGFHAVMMVLLMPMWLLSGSFFPATEGVMGWIVRLNPLSYGVAGLRFLLQSNTEGAALASPGFCVVITCLFAAATFALACFAARRRTQGDLL